MKVKPNTCTCSIICRYHQSRAPGLFKYDIKEVGKDNLDFYLMRGNYEGEWEAATAHLKEGAKAEKWADPTHATG